VKDHPLSAEILHRNRRYIPGGMSSTNRLTDPVIAFVRGDGSHIWDAEGNEYIDYHGAFAPQFLGYCHPEIRRAVAGVMTNGEDLFGSGPTELEGRLAQLVCTNIPWIEKFVVFCSGSEATQQALRLARAATGRDHIIVIQGGYNGWHNDVACNLMTALDRLGPRRSPGEYEFIPISAGIPAAHQALVHPINFNDLDSVRYVCERYDVAGMLLEPILQNVGVLKPAPGYLEGLRDLADRYGFLLMFDEVKTGFRHSFGGYAEICGVAPDLAVYGKALASGYPLGAIGGKAKWLDYFYHDDPAKRVLLAGTYNGHPIPTAAALATLEVLLRDGGAVYRHVDGLGARVQQGLDQVLRESGIESVVARQGSAFVIYFMDHAPRDWHDLAASHDAELDRRFRRSMIDSGVYFFPAPMKQCSISALHTGRDIDLTVEAARAALRGAVAVTR
jgi:glutamate-1-semialdehyde 2,1-aminomutase